MKDYAKLLPVLGYKDFRPGQEILIRGILNQKDVFGVMPTGAGKSLCYQLPALLLDGLTIVVSPLIALMQDQITKLQKNGIKAEFINSTQSLEEYNAVLQRVASGSVKILYVSPERLSNTRFLQFCRNITISMVAVDEAHCISQWGHNFRPDYNKIAPFIHSLPKRPIVSAFTATATATVRKDICVSLGLINPVIQINSFDRQNLFYEVQSNTDKDAALFDFVEKNKGKSGIVYCSTKKNTETVNTFLRENGFSSTFYHAD